MQPGEATRQRADVGDGGQRQRNGDAESAFRDDAPRCPEPGGGQRDSRDGRPWCTRSEGEQYRQHDEGKFDEHSGRDPAQGYPPPMPQGQQNQAVGTVRPHRFPGSGNDGEDGDRCTDDLDLGRIQMCR